MNPVRTLGSFHFILFTKLSQYFKLTICNQTALHSLLRRASSFVVPLVIRADGSPRPFRRVLSGVSTSENGELVHALNRRASVPSLRFSTESADESLIRVIESEIELTKNKFERRYSENNLEEVLAVLVTVKRKRARTSTDHHQCNLKLRSSNRFGGRTLLLTKNYQDELIKFEVEIPQLENIKEEKEEEDEDEDDENKINILNDVF